MTGIAALGALAFLMARGAGDRYDRPLLALLPCAFYATGVTIAAGQLMVHLLPAVLGTIVLLSPAKGPGEGRPSLARDAAVAALFVALAKPSATLPFLWLLLLPPRRARPALLAGGGYLAVTLLACAFRPTAFAEYLTAGLQTARGVAATSGYGHLGVWPAALGPEKWLPAAELPQMLAWTLLLAALAAALSLAGEAFRRAASAVS
ncbi:MAG TPA: hypothetical protein VF121_06255 [Thermoanaerobaculia bacterium]|nr:hypothetical protein [Thermoanaerobaculia bacterium]